MRENGLRLESEPPKSSARQPELPKDNPFLLRSISGLSVIRQYRSSDPVTFAAELSGPIHIALGF